MQDEDLKAVLDELVEIRKRIYVSGQIPDDPYERGKSYGISVGEGRIRRLLFRAGQNEAKLTKTSGGRGRV